MRMEKRPAWAGLELTAPTRVRGSRVLISYQRPHKPNRRTATKPTRHKQVQHKHVVPSAWLLSNIILLAYSTLSASEWDVTCSPRSLAIASCALLANSSTVSSSPFVKTGKYLDQNRVIMKKIYKLYFRYWTEIGNFDKYHINLHFLIASMTLVLQIITRHSRIPQWWGLWIELAWLVTTWH